MTFDTRGRSQSSSGSGTGTGTATGTGTGSGSSTSSGGSGGGSCVRDNSNDSINLNSSSSYIIARNSNSNVCDGGGGGVGGGGEGDGGGGGGGSGVVVGPINTTNVVDSLSINCSTSLTDTVNKTTSICKSNNSSSTTTTISTTTASSSAGSAGVVGGNGALLPVVSTSSSNSSNSSNNCSNNNNNNNNNNLGSGSSVSGISIASTTIANTVVNTSVVNNISSNSNNNTEDGSVTSTVIASTSLLNPLSELPGGILNGNTMTISPEKLISSFPTLKLRTLTQKISNPRWVVPVLPEQELEVLLNAAITLTAAGVDHDCEPCVEFYRNALTTSFTKILTDEAVNSWKYNIHHCILISCGKLLHLIAIHMTRDNPYLLDLLAIVFDPDNKFNIYNAARQPECFLPPNNLWGIMDGNRIYAKSPPEPKNPRGWLVDMINLFGQLGGFDRLQERFNTGLQILRKQQQQQQQQEKEQESISGSSGGNNMISGVFGCTVPMNKSSTSKVMGCYNSSNVNTNYSIRTSSSTSSLSPSIIATGASTSSFCTDSEYENRLTLALIYSLLRPFGQCYELLLPSTISKYFMPIWKVVLDLLDSFSDEELKREAKPEGRNDFVNGIVKSARYLASRLPGQEDLIRSLEMFRLKMILRLLQVSSFNGKMNALNEINKVLTSVSYYSHRAPQMSHCLPDDDMDWLTAERMAAWIKESNVLGIVLKDSLHQPQYVEKLEKIIRFLIKEHALTLEDLDAVWKAQAGKHEAIVKNVHDLLAKLAWDFTPEQLDHLFESFQASMTTANKRQRERLLELIRRLAEDDKNGVMAQKVLKLFWTLAHSQEIQPEVLDQALAAHVKILDYSCSQERDAQKIVWLEKCVSELNSDGFWVLPALRLIREICCLYESLPNQPLVPPTIPLSRQQVIDRLQHDHSLVVLVTNSLSDYINKLRIMVNNMPNLDPTTFCIDGRYAHTLQIQERLDFLKFLLKDGQLWLCAEQAKQIWNSLAVMAVFPSDREECFRWFGKLMGDEPDLDPGINRDFFENNIMQLDPQLLTESGIKCFERFFKAVNSKENKLKAVHRGYILDDEDLIGKDYLWRVITTAGEEIANRAIDLLKEVSTALSPRLQEKIHQFHELFIAECCDRLRTHYCNVTILGKTLASLNVMRGSLVVADETTAVSQSDQNNDTKDTRLRYIEAEKLCRIIKVLQEYIKECDRVYTGDRYQLPLMRATRGKHTSLYIRFQNPGRPIEDIEVITHNNEMMSAFRRNLLKRIKGTYAANIKVDFYYNNGEPIDIQDDINPLSQYTIRDKMLLTAKLTPMGTGLASSPDSSSDSSTGSPPRPCPDMQRVELESTLPGVIISHNYQYIDFFLKLYQLGSDLEHDRLRESAKLLLHLLPCDGQTVKMLHMMCGLSTTFIDQQSQHSSNLSDSTKDDEDVDNSGNSGNSSGNLGNSSNDSGPDLTTSNIEKIRMQDCTPDMMFVHPSPAQVHYNLCVLNALLMPALEPYGDAATQLLYCWLQSGCAHFILELLTKNNFLPNADMHTKRAAFQSVLRLVKLFLYIMGCVLSRVGDEPISNDYEMGVRSQVEILKQILTSIPNTSEVTLRAISQKLAELLAREMLSASPEGERRRILFASTLQWSCPDISTIKAVVQLAWSSSFGSLHLLGNKHDFSDEIATLADTQDFIVCKEAMEVLTISLVLNPSANEVLSNDPLWSKFITSLVLMNQHRHIRQVAAEQLFLTCTYCAGDRRSFGFMINLLVNSLKTLVPQYESTCADFFQLLCRTLSYGCVVNWPLNIGEGLLAEEIKWLLRIRDNVANTGDIQVHEDLLEGHLCLAKELLLYLSPETKAQLSDLIHDLISDFIFTASREYLHLRKHGVLKREVAPPPVCRSPHTIAAACDLLIALAQNCVPNMKLLTNTIIDFVCNDTDPLREWDYLPPIGVRPMKGFCGLKNAGATCYMNSVLQQLYMVPSIRVGILQAEGAALNENEDFSGDLDVNHHVSSVLFASSCTDDSGLGGSSGSSGTSLNSNSGSGIDIRKNYHVTILKHVQAIFAHLGHSALQFYVPRGLWTHFKLQGESVNLREQQDAVEFFMSLFESLDEGLKALGHTQLMNATLGGSFSDQKICQECPHRYSKEEPFSVFSVDIRNHSSLTESLEQYVKGELLEGADAYHCDKCDKKVVTIKRLCVKKLPPVLAIQLKRFEYDYDRVCAIKFNDYFEFPRVLDMEPYTVSGLAKLEGEIIEVGDNCQTNCETTKYDLTGIVVHSGQASGGHYFSYILSKNSSTGREQWYKFDDGEVSECKMHEDDEMKAQCFGGDYMGEIYDSNLKRMQYRRQKRWWNAYMLFYTRCDQNPVRFDPCVEQLSLAESRNFVLPLPKPIERSVRTQNIRFLHSKTIFSVEFFNFIKKLVSCTIPTNRIEKVMTNVEELSVLAMQLASQFLFHTGFRTKKSLRGPVIEWYDTLSHHIRFSSGVRRWFAANALLSPPSRLAEYILVAPSPEVRTIFVKLVVIFCHYSANDDPLPGFEGSTLCEQILIGVLKLLKCEVADHGKNLPHYFSLFSMYVGLGTKERQQLLKLNVPVIFMQVALDEGPGPSIKYQFVELSKLHQVVAQLIRCSDVSEQCQSSTQSARLLPNPYKDTSIGYDELMPVSPECVELLFNRTGYIKKLMEDTNVGEEGLLMLQYCSWENPHFSRSVLNELLWHCSYAYCHDMRQHTELLLNILVIEDSWQHHRIHNALNGVTEEREGLLEIIHNAKSHYQKRAYQIIKCLTQLFHKSTVALQMLNSNATVCKQWVNAVEWLHDELDRQRTIGCQYNSYSWSPPAQSNDNTNGYMLERSQSAKNTWSMAYELCPEEEPDEQIELDVESIDDDGLQMQQQCIQQNRHQLQQQQRYLQQQQLEAVDDNSKIHQQRLQQNRQQQRCQQLRQHYQHHQQQQQLQQQQEQLQTLQNSLHPSKGSQDNPANKEQRFNSIFDLIRNNMSEEETSSNTSTNMTGEEVFYTASTTSNQKLLAITSSATNISTTATATTISTSLLQSPTPSTTIISPTTSAIDKWKTTGNSSIDENSALFTGISLSDATTGSSSTSRTDITFTETTVKAEDVDSADEKSSEKAFSDRNLNGVAGELTRMSLSPKNSDIGISSKVVQRIAEESAPQINTTTTSLSSTKVTVTIGENIDESGDDSDHEETVNVLNALNTLIQTDNNSTMSAPSTLSSEKLTSSTVADQLTIDTDIKSEETTNVSAIEKTHALSINVSDNVTTAVCSSSSLPLPITATTDLTPEVELNFIRNQQLPSMSKDTNG